MTDRQTEFFDELYIQYARKMLLWANRQVQNAETAADLVNETFLLLVMNIDEVEKHVKPEGWLFVTLRNATRTMLRQKQRQKELPMDTAGEIAGQDGVALPLADCLPRGMSEEDRQILVWFYEDKRSCAEIAEHLGITAEAARRRLCRARERCGQRLRDDGQTQDRLDEI